MLMRKVSNEALAHSNISRIEATGRPSMKDDSLLDDLLTNSKIEEAKLVAVDDFEAPFVAVHSEVVDH